MLLDNLIIIYTEVSHFFHTRAIFLVCHDIASTVDVNNLAVYECTYMNVIYAPCIHAELLTNAYVPPVLALLSSPSEHHYDEPHAMFLSKRVDSSAQSSGPDSETSTMASPVSRGNQAGDSGTARSHSASSYCSSREFCLVR